MNRHDPLTGPLSLPPNSRFSDLSALAHAMPPEFRREYLEAIDNVLDGAGSLMTKYAWPLKARHNQTPPLGSWSIWLLLAGRGFGKTRTGAEWVRARVESGQSSRIALVARTRVDVRDVMILGESGLINISPPWFRPVYEPSKRKLTWPNGAAAYQFSSYEPDQLRGPQFDAAWCDEIASWEYPRATWDNLAFALRLGTEPRCVVTTTPKPIALLRELTSNPDVLVTRGTSYDNEANLTDLFFSQIRSRYEGTRTGRQEIYAELLDQAEDALWHRQWIDDARVAQQPKDIRRIVVAIDPAVTSNPRSAETGIVVAGVDRQRRCYVLADGSGRMTPNAWAARAISLYDRFHADRIIGETNNGGDLVKQVLLNAESSRNLPFRAVTASRGKFARAEPIASLYEQGKVHHVGLFSDLEDQMCTWTPRSSNESSNDRIDALVWALSELNTHRTPRIWT